MALYTITLDSEKISREVEADGYDHHQYSEDGSLARREPSGFVGFYRFSIVAEGSSARVVRETVASFNVDHVVSIEKTEEA